MPSRKQRNKPSADQQQWADRKWAELEAQLDHEMLILGPSREQAGRILYEMKSLLRKYGLNRGRRGRWQAVLRKYQIDRKTAENWIRLYQEKAAIAADKLVVAPAKKSQKNTENNTVKATSFEPESSVIIADDEDKDDTSEGRLPVECVFVLTYVQSRTLKEALEELGPVRLTQAMYQGVAAELERSRKGLGSSI